MMPYPNTDGGVVGQILGQLLFIVIYHFLFQTKNTVAYWQMNIGKYTFYLCIYFNSNSIH